MRRVLGWVLLAAAGCAPAAPEERPAEAGPPTRIVALTCAAVDVLTVLGELDRVVAVEEDCPAPGTEGKVKIRNDDHPGQVHRINVESVLALRPDAVIAKPDLREVLGGKGLRVLWTPPVVHRGNLEAFVADVAALVGVPERGREVVASMRAKEESIRARVAGRPPVRVYYETTGAGRTVGRLSIVNDMILLAGGVSVSGHEEQANVTLNAEAILAADPEVIVLGAFADPPDVVAARPGWQRIAAVRNGRIHQVPLERRFVTLATPRCVDGCEEMLLPWLHPDLGAPREKR